MEKYLKLVLALSMVAILNSCEKNNDDDKGAASNWIQLGSSFDSQIYDVMADKDSNIYMSGGELWNILVWDGTSWSSLGDVSASPFTGGLYWPITIDKDGNVYAVGYIEVPLANSEYHIAKWVKSSNTWINLTSDGPLFDNGIYSLVTDTLGNLYVSGNVLYLNSVESGNYIYKWDGSAWSMLGGTKLYGEYPRLHIDNEGNLFTNLYNENISPCVSKWNGSGWDELGGTNTSNFGTGHINCLNSDSKGNVYAGGYFVVGDSAFNIFRWTKLTNSWTALHTFGSSSDVNSIVFDTADTLYVAGNFVDSTDARYVAKYHGNKWSNYGNLKANNTINSICFDVNGNMYAGGMFTNPDNQYYVAVYNKR